MNKTLQIGTAMLAALDTKDFLRRNGDSLSEVLEGVAGDRGLDLYLAADRILDGLSPDPARVGRALQDICDLLAESCFPEDRHAAAVRWHGARLTDLAARLP
jgi:hypothetical protein